MQIIELKSTDDDLVDGVAALESASYEVDSPWRPPVTPTQVRGWLDYGWDLEPGRHFAGIHESRVLAHGTVHTSEWDNLDLAWLELLVHPDHRRQGLGREMYEHLVQVAADMGRTKLGTDAWDGNEGVGFAQRRGFTIGSVEVQRRQHPQHLDANVLQELYDGASQVASAYELVRIAGRTPEPMMPAVAEMTAAINDAPWDDLEIEDEAFPPARIRNYETATIETGHRLYRLVARHRETGVLAGHTVVAVESERPTVAHQHDTSVVRAHRGHRLGLLLKGGMNLWLAEAEPQIETVDTWNAESNAHMISVNELLGYQILGRIMEMQRTLQA